MIYLAYNFDPSNASERAQTVMETLRNHELSSLFIEPASACNLSCKFCDFHSNKVNPFIKQKGIMSPDTFSLVMENLRALSFRFKVLYFNLHGEPLLNPHIASMVSTAVNNGIAERYSLSTNGLLLTDTRLRELIEAGIDSIIVSLDTVRPDKYKNFKGSGQLDMVIDNIFNAIEVIASTKRKVSLQIKCTLQSGRYGISEEDTESVLLLFKKHAENSDRIHIYFLKEFSWYTRSKEGELVADHRLCDQPFYQLAIHYDGMVSACCMDINHDLTLGRLSDQLMLDQMIRGEALRRLRQIHLSGNLDQLPICKFCEIRPVTELGCFVEEIRSLI